MAKRKAIAPETEAAILLESARRCALCFGFNGDLGRKKGQIAHIGQDSTRADESDLVYLCLDHHDEYDSTTSQAKGVTRQELSTYKRRLLEAVANGEHLKYEAAKTADQRRQEVIHAHDERIFRKSDRILPEPRLRQFLGELQSDDSYIMSELRIIDTFRHFFADTGNQYIDAGLSESLRSLLAAIDSLLVFIAYNFFVYPRGQEDREHLRLCLYPNLNIDREGSGSHEDMARYDKFAEQLDKLADETRAAYRAYRMAIKTVLII